MQISAKTFDVYGFRTAWTKACHKDCTSDTLWRSGFRLDHSYNKQDRCEKTLERASAQEAMEMAGPPTNNPMLSNKHIFSLVSASPCETLQWKKPARLKFWDCATFFDNHYRLPLCCVIEQNFLQGLGTIWTQ